MGFFNNQDWVWGLGLIISGAFFAFAVIKRGVKRFRQTYLNVEFNDLQIGTWFDWVIKFVVPIEAIAILVFWSYQSVTTYDPEGWWHPFRSFSLGTCVVQWGLLILLLFSLNSRLHQMLGTKESVNGRSIDSHFHGADFGIYLGRALLLCESCGAEGPE